MQSEEWILQRLHLLTIFAEISGIDCREYSDNEIFESVSYIRCFCTGKKHEFQSESLENWKRSVNKKIINTKSKVPISMNTTVLKKVKKMTLYLIEVEHHDTQVYPPINKRRSNFAKQLKLLLLNI